MYKTKLTLSNKSDKGNGLWITRLLVAILSLVLNSCSGITLSTTDSALVDKSFLTGKPCTAPCWYGLEIDKSTRADTLDKLNQLDFVKHNAYKEYGTVWNNDQNAREIQFYCLNQPNEVCGGALISNNILKRLWLKVGYDLSLKDVIDKIGPPDFQDYELQIQGGCNISLWWTERGILINIIENNYTECQKIADGSGISPQKMVKLITYFAKEDFGEPGDCCKRIPWPGFAKQEQ
jgi:hypothetical protein